MTVQTTGQAEPPPPEPAMLPLILRAGFGGTLMGLANLVPGISGGTMLLAAGIYTRFIEAIAAITTLRFTLRNVLVLATVVAAAIIAIAALSGPVKDLVVNQRWIMYSIFIGLTLGGVPLVWELLRPATKSAWAGAAAGFLAMGALAVLQQSSTGTSGASQTNILLLVLAGVAGASAMILPGVSGGYLLLVLGQYVPILGAIDRFKDAVVARDADAAVAEFATLIPVGLGVAVGVVVVSNALRLLLRRYPKPTLGALLGLLLGAVLGLWPFQQGTPPQPGDYIKGVLVTEQTAGAVPPDDWPLRFFTPSIPQVAAALALILIGFAITHLISHIGRERSPRRSAG